MIRSEAKKIAKENLNGRFGTAILAMLIYAAVCSVLGLAGGLPLLLFSSGILIGYQLFNIKLMKEQTADLNVLIEGFTKQDVSRVIILSCLKNLFIFLWTLLFFIPGLVKSYSYLLAEYIAIRRKDLTAEECITESRKLMDGHKWEMFVFDLSFILWIFVVILSFGIASLYVVPYMEQSRTVYIHNNIYKLYSTDELEVFEE